MKYGSVKNHPIYANIFIFIREKNMIWASKVKFTLMNGMQITEIKHMPPDNELKQFVNF